MSEENHEYDMTARHYQPAGRSPVCGAAKRVSEREKEGKAERHSLLKIPTSTNILKVTCILCRAWILGVTDEYRDQAKRAEAQT